MARIRERWGRAIESAVASRQSAANPHSPLPSREFLAALIANESGGEPEARRFEPQVFERLTNIRDPEQRRLAASSLGLTQIMGYHPAERDGVDPVRLFDPEFNLRFALQMLADFAGRWELHLSTDCADHADLFRCWNTGSPKGKTHDPDYVAKGLARMKIYAELCLESDPTRSKGVGG